MSCLCQRPGASAATRAHLPTSMYTGELALDCNTFSVSSAASTSSIAASWSDGGAFPSPFTSPEDTKPLMQSAKQTSPIVPVQPPPISHLASFLAEWTVYFFFGYPPSSSPRSRKSTMPVASNKFRSFCHHVLATTQVSHSVVILALLFICRIRKPEHGGRFAGKQPADSEYVPTIVALALANKMLDDHTYTAKTWSEVSGLPLNHINNIEKAFCKDLHYSFHVAKQEFDAWQMLLDGTQSLQGHAADSAKQPISTARPHISSRRSGSSARAKSTSPISVRTLLQNQPQISLDDYANAARHKRSANDAFAEAEFSMQKRLQTESGPYSSIPPQATAMPNYGMVPNMQHAMVMNRAFSHQTSRPIRPMPSFLHSQRQNVIPRPPLSAPLYSTQPSTAQQVWQQQPQHLFMPQPMLAPPHPSVLEYYALAAGYRGGIRSQITVPQNNVHPMMGQVPQMGYPTMFNVPSIQASQPSTPQYFSTIGQQHSSPAVIISPVPPSSNVSTPTYFTLPPPKYPAFLHSQQLPPVINSGSFNNAGPAGITYAGQTPMSITPAQYYLRQPYLTTPHHPFI